MMRMSLCLAVQAAIAIAIQTSMNSRYKKRDKYKINSVCLLTSAMVSSVASGACCKRGAHPCCTFTESPFSTSSWPPH